MKYQLIKIAGLVTTLAILAVGCGSDDEAEPAVITGEETCTSGETKCEGNAVATCAEDGSWTVDQDCGEGFVCSEPSDSMPSHHCMPEGEEGTVELLSIAATAAADPQFSTLVEAATAAGLVETLGGEGEYTVFAPTNDAFAALPEGTLDDLLADTNALTTVLLYHAVAGTVLAEEVVTLTSATTLATADIAIEVVDGGVVLNGNVNVTATDIVCSNGVIHVIDGVLLPPAGGEEGGEATTEEGGEATTEEGGEATTAEGACTNPEDLAIVESIDIQDSLGEFAMQCVDISTFSLNPQCLIEKLLEKHDLSEECGMCFVDTAVCGADNCLTECMDQGQDCIDCSAEAGCVDALEECSGLQQP